MGAANSASNKNSLSSTSSTSPLNGTPLPPSQKNDVIDEKAKDKYTIVESSPTNRFVRYDEVLGKGAYKTVHLACDSQEGDFVAWNTITLKGLPKSEKVRIT